MTLVYRTPKSTQLKPIHNLAPGSYNIKSQFTNNNHLNHLTNLSNTYNLNKPKNTQRCIFISSTPRDPFQINKHIKQQKQKEKLNQKNKSKSKKTKQNDQNKTDTHQQKSNSQTKNNQQSNNNTQNNNEKSLDLIKSKKYRDCSNVFNSKVKRFQQGLQKDCIQQKNKQILLIQQFKKLLIKDMNKTNKGKLFKTKDKLQKQKQILYQQVFPSIPNWQNSYGYRFDPQTNKWVTNQNPNLMQMLIQKDKLNPKNNYSLGPGYYFFKQNKCKNYHQSLNTIKQNMSPDLIQSMVHPNIKPQTPIHNSIEQDQAKMKLRIRLIGQNKFKKTQQLVSNTQKILQIEDKNITSKNKRQILLLNQMYKKFGQYIPKQQKLSPSKYLQQAQQNKLNHSINKSLNQNQNINPHQHFLSKSKRFYLQNNQLSLENKSSVIKQNSQTDEYSTQQNSSLILKSHNCKEPYSLGEDRFKQTKDKQNLGPGKYYQQKSWQSTKLSPCLNLKESRFNYDLKKSDFPSPGDYDVSQKLIKKQNNLRNIFAQYKQHNKESIKRYFKRQDSMESLYQTWGRQMNYIAKMQNNLRPQQKQEDQQKSKKYMKSNSLTKVKKQLQKQLKNYSSIEEQKYNKAFHNERIVCQVQQSQNKNKDKKYKQKIYPKIKKHLYQYNKLPEDNKEEQMGPGKYQIKNQMVKKTYNVTYT